MNVPEVIDRGNATFLAPAQRALKEGKTVIVAYDGLHAASFQQYDTREQAMQALVGLQNSVAATPSIHFKVLFPDGSELAADRPAVQLLDNEPDDPILPGPGAGQDGPQLTAEEDGALQVAVTQRDRAATALQAAAFAFAKAQDVCTDLAEKLRARLQADAGIVDQTLN